MDLKTENKRMLKSYFLSQYVLSHMKNMNYFIMIRKEYECHSLNILNEVKNFDPTIFTKSGIMVGLGETEPEVLQTMDDLRSTECRPADTPCDHQSQRT